MSSHRSRRSAARRKSARRTSIEPLESRQMFAAEPLVGGINSAIGGSIEQHAVSEPDFWYDTGLEREIDALLGDVQQTLAAANQLTGLTQARNEYGFMGYGQTVAVIDSGIAWDHPNLGGGFGTGYRVVGGWDFGDEKDADPYDDGPSGAHGTHVAGIVGATKGPTGDEGVAPGVDLVGLRVFNDQGAGYFGWVEQALRWIHTNRNTFANPITAVNLSLGTAWNAATVPSWAMLEDEFAQLKADGIFIAVSAGNSFTSYNVPGLSYPAASSSVIPVMAVDDGGGLSYFSQRHERAIAAPGRTIRSTVPDYVGNQNGRTDDWASFSGTSMAAPYVAGASVLVREAMEFVGYTNITQDTIYDHMMSTADEIFDTATNATYKRLNVGAAIAALMPEDDFGSTTETAFDLGTIDSSATTLSGLIGGRSDVDCFRFTAAASGTVTFTATTSDYLSPMWSGGGVVSEDGKSYMVTVVAGESYTFGISTSEGVGRFTLEVSAERAFSFVDLGTIAQAEMAGLSTRGETWYRVTASRAGILTAESLLSGASGNVELAWFDASLNRVSVETLATGGQRVDHFVEQGQQLYLRVAGTSADGVDIRLTNLVTQDSSTLHISGTAGDDTIVLSGGGEQTVSVNGVVYHLDPAVTQVIVDGLEGRDTVTSKAGSEVSLRTQDVESVTDLDAQAYSLDQDLGLRFSKSYYLNYSGFQEKWVLGNQGWYIITPDGSLYRAKSNATLAEQKFVAQLDASYYADPSLLHEAQISNIALDQQQINQVANLNLRFNRSYCVNWGGMNEKWVYGDNRKWYFVTPDGNLYQWAGGADVTGSTMVMHVGAAAYNAPAVLQDAAYFGSSSKMLAEELDASLNLHSQGSYATNWGGWNEKWIKGDGNTWYFITPSGGFYEWSGQGMANNRFLAALDPSFYAKPARLHDSAPPAGVQAAAFAQLAAETATDHIEVTASNFGSTPQFTARKTSTAGGLWSRRVTAERSEDANLVYSILRSEAGVEMLHDKIMGERRFVAEAANGRGDTDWLVSISSQDTLGSLQSAFSQWAATQR